MQAQEDAALRGWKRRFFTIWAGQAFSLLGSSLVQFALVWWLTQTTHSATVLATATLVAMLPGVVIGPFAGALVDRWNRKAVMLVADGCVALATAILIYLYVAGAMQVWHIYAIMFVRSVFGSFHWPAMQASTSLMVPKQQLSRVAGMNQTLFGVMNIVSPPLGALLIGILPLHGVMMIDVVTAALAMSCLAFVHIPQPVRNVSAGQGPAAVLIDVREGWRYMVRWRGMLALGVMATLINFLVNPAFVLMPILVTKHFGGGAMELGTLESAWGFGVVAGGLLLSVWGGFRRRMVTSLLGILGMGLGILVIGATPGSLFGMALAGMALAGLMNPICNGPLNAILQTVVAPEMQGRVMAVVGSMAGAMSPISMLIAGPVADAIGVQAWYIAGGLGCLVMALVALGMPSVMHLEENGHAAAGLAALQPEPVLAEAAIEQV
jgi:MFS transporter, DHA3 family, macrolide efflux protein